MNESLKSVRPARAIGVGLVVVLGLVVLGVVAYLVRQPAGTLPARDSTTYRETARSFYRGLAALDVGLLDDAASEFMRAAELVPTEAASWANLGLSRVRRGAFEAAVDPLNRARTLAPDNADIALLQGLLAGAAGQLEQGIAHLRRAVEIAPDNLRARYALAEAVERAAGPTGDRDAQQQLEAILARGENLAVRLERARLAVKLAEGPALAESLAQLRLQAGGWPPLAEEQLGGVEQAVAAGDFGRAATAIALLRNVLVRVAAFRESLAAVQTPPELIGEPLDRFVVLPAVRAAAAAPDEALAYTDTPIDIVGDFPASGLLALQPADAESPTVLAASAGEVRSADVASAPIPFPAGASGAPPSDSSLLALDWNHDFRTDLVLAGRGGLRVFAQEPDGRFTDATEAAADAVSGLDSFGAWAADVEMDGDLDMVVGISDGAAIVLRNNGDGTWIRRQPFDGVAGVREFVWGDLDRDGDPDAVLLDSEGGLHMFANEQAGQFRPWPAPDSTAPALAVALGDLDADGVLDLAALQADGAVWRISAGDGIWEQAQIASWSGMASAAAVGAPRLLLADLDNNGALDLVASHAAGTAVWLADEQRTLLPLAVTPDAEIFGVADENGDGLLDLLGLDAGRPVWLHASGTRAYRWQMVRPRAQVAAGDQRINTFGVGGEVEVRAGLLRQKQVLSGAPVHFGLGSHAAADVVRIAWPNGVMQAEFDQPADGVIVAQQRLKGSCPWVFAYDGERQRFVTDFIWRSPLGLRINAQDTAEVAQTEDWIRIRGDQLAPRDGVYDIRITAELWETHFFDHVALLAVDHPEDVAVFVDERFSRESPKLEVRATERPRPLARARDDAGQDVTAILGKQDGRYLASFDRGAYQGIAGDHFVEFELGEPTWSPGEPVWLIAYGWVYPTDSSINVAIGQRGDPVPRGLALEVQEPGGGWSVVHPDLGFPAGKNKTILVNLGPALRDGGSPRMRLRTNLEVYWDWMGYAAGAPEERLATTRLAAATADLRYRGFSRTTFEGPRRLELPLYDQLANVTQQWRDLVGYHTRFGAVGELLERVDDRYVIMNAGDELQLEFPALPPPRPGLMRDFVLIGDGWVKDGDFNTGFSRTVRPLPSHDRPAYDASGLPAALEDDPVYRRHRGDWEKYHTRYVTPDRLLGGTAIDPR